MTASRHFHDWPELLRQAAELIRAGKVKPQGTELAKALGVNRNTFVDAMRKYGIGGEVLAYPDRWPLPTAVQSDDPSFEGIRASRVISVLRRGGPMTLDQLGNALDRGAATVERVLGAMIAGGYDVVREEGRVKLAAYSIPERARVLSDESASRVAFAVASDWHIGSKAAQVSALRAFIEMAVKKYEIRHILVPGDICAGFGVYKGQANEVYAQGASEQLDALVNTIPEYSGVSFYILGGNHDYSFVKTSGFNIVKVASQIRPDWIYLGFDEAVVPLTKDLDIVLWHPSGGVPYALTYRGQKFAAELAQRELVEIITGKKDRPRTRFIFWGHLHVAASFPHGPIRVVGPGCFEGRNSYLKQKGLTPKIQGVIVEADITKDGLIQRYVGHEIEYVEEDEDWRNAYIPSVAKASTNRINPIYRVKSNKNGSGK